MFSNKTTYDSSTKIWSGPQKKPGPLDKYSSLGQAIFENLTNNPENICQISDTDGISLKNHEILTLSVRIAQRLEIEEGSIIGIMAASSTYQSCVLIAAWFRGIVFHPISNSFDKKTTQHVFGITRPKIVFCDADNYETLMAACNEINLHPKVYTIKGRVEGVGCLNDLMEATGKEGDFRPKQCNQDDIAVIMGSSGTTGLPKGVCISNIALLKMFTPLPNGTVMFACCNVDWITGLIFLLFSSLFCVTRICTEEQFSPEMLRQLIEKYKINAVMMSGSCMSRFIKSGEADLCDCSSLRLFAVGGGNVSHPMYVKMQECIKSGIVLNTYGGTEFGGVTVSANIDKPKSVGQLGAEVKVRIVNDNSNNVGIDEIGEILVSNNTHWNGYYGNPKETTNMIDSEGWFHTGDIGYFDKEGDLYLVDRKKEIMKYRGFHYSAQEIENCILTLDGIAEVCVFGTRVDEFEDLATAAVIRRNGCQITEKDIRDHVAKELSQPMWLHGGVYFVDNIPKTPSGKYQRSKIRDNCLQNKEIQ
ncbi:luciferin 4-monooxygenase-like [Eupeodes corollae]|uniref:luciferin 4-monooxygenase-like n=1 Tax=Eupeodes corollae TaxID=290404 RepID=UPI002493C4F4|nr:luciferin 4-monooxygenase-like [Eupeodes corollae]XP_055910376.1 luciferin 4-monooxygenase-like [Eupeodes corollae]XP_055910377.1 luciferin 4-monooxygenase-like [Eupeodes corollae]XP_055910378.1 luciferin 4-monooxygenase-like [Eupeodes corollae]XP_055910379.1 luciferin 4-monooxygenase-like [Eupeodes corollae]